MTCTCGKTDDHVVARRMSADGVHLELWSTGEITGRLGLYPPGLGRARSHSRFRAAALAWDDVCLYDWAEIGALVKAARKALEQVSLPRHVAMRRLMLGERMYPGKRGSTVECHHHSCPCARCGGRNLGPGWIAGPVKLAT